jgi:tetratricopeptide (TPR) repeat protein
MKTWSSFRVREQIAIRLLSPCALAFLLVAFCASARQDPGTYSSSKPSQSAPTSSSSTTMPGADQPPFNPLPAEKDLEVATFYMKKGDPDAAIPRLEEAIKLNPNLAKPYLLLGEIFEKKKDSESALKYYQQYLKVFPHAPDAKKVQEKVVKLQAK